MYDARIFLNTLDDAKEVLKKNNFEFKGEYTIHDIIYTAKSGEPLEKVFLRLRIISKNIWNDKPVVVAIKNTEIKEIGKQSIIPLKKQFDTEEEGRTFIEQHYLDQFECLYEFDRIGWQYDSGTDQVDLEDIEGHYSIEFKSETEEGLAKLVNLFDAKGIISGPSVVAIKEILKR